MRRSLTLGLMLVCFGCRSSDPGTDDAAEDGGGSADGDESSDGGGASDGGVGSAPQFEYVEVDGAVCANGTPLGLGISEVAGARDRVDASIYDDLVMQWDTPPLRVALKFLATQRRRLDRYARDRE
jgi:hypothetical protein